MSNTLDLRPDKEKEILVVEKLVSEKRSLIKESFKTFGSILLVLVVVWGVSHADEVGSLISLKQEVKAFSAVGSVGDVTGTNLTLNNANGSDGQKNTSYVFDISTVEKIETRNYVPLAISDIKSGDNIVVQGTVDNNSMIQIKRIISFSATSSQANIVDISDLNASSTVATSTATSTPDTSTPADATSTPTTTPDADASTTDATSTATSTPSVIDNVVNTIQNVINTVVDVITGTSTPDDSTSTPVVTPDTTPAPDVTPAPADTTTPPPADNTPAPAPDQSTN